MTLEILQKDMITALKNNDMVTKTILSEMIDTVQKASMTNKGRVEITENLVNEALIKYQKSVQEQVDTCPINRDDLKTKYIKELKIVKNYAPQLITDIDEIKNLVINLTSGIEMTKSNKGKIMKVVMPAVKSKADSAIVNRVISGMLQ